MKNKFIVIHLFLLAVFTQSCKNQLVSDGAISLAGKTSVMDEQSNVTLFSYYNNYPEYIATLSLDNGELTIPRSYLVPKKDFDTLENELIHTDRTKPNTFVALDMFVKVYNKNSSTKDQYYEAPVLGPNPAPSNITTALSWILRWSFNSKTIRLSRSQFEKIVDAVTIACTDCSKKTNSELVQMILGTSHLVGKILDAANEANRLPAPALNATSLNYQPPDVDYVWSSPLLSSNWTLYTNNTEPLGQSTENVLVDVLLVKPLESETLKSPDSWRHQSKDLAESDDAYIEQNSISGTPLQYAIDNDSAGMHKFTSLYTDGTSRTLTVYSTIRDSSITPSCIASGVATVRANKLLVIDLDQTIIPNFSPNSASDRLTAVNVAINKMQYLPPLASANTYTITFTTGLSDAVSYTISRTTSGTVGTTNITTSPISYISGRLISFYDGSARYSLYVAGTPNNNDKIVFTTPYEPSSQKQYFENYGCMDSDPWKEASSIEFRPKSFPANANINSVTGRLSWTTKTTDYNPLSTLTSPSASLTFTVIDTTSRESYDYTISVLVTEDHLPRFCALPKLVSSNGSLSDGTSPLVVSTNPATAGSSICSGTAPVFTPTSGTNTVAYGQLQEMKSLNQTLYFSDEDGDAFKVTISKGPQVLPDLTFSSSTLWNTDSIFTAGVSTTALQPYTWNFKAATNQINSTATNIITSGTVNVVFTVQYINTPTTTINTGMTTSFAVKVYIENSVDSPVVTPTATNLTICGGVCNSTQARIDLAKSRYTALTPSGASETRQFKDLKTNTNYTTAVSPPLFEGEVATLEIPLVGRLTGTSSGIPVLYQFTNSANTSVNSAYDNRTCKFADPGRIKFEEVKCLGSSSTTNDCLKVYLNYNIITDTQDPLPYNASMGTSDYSCELQLKAFNKDFPGVAGTALGNYKLYIQNKNIGSPYLATTPAPTEIKNGSTYPREGVQFNLLPLLQPLFADADMGSLIASSTVITAPSTSCVTACTRELSTLNATGWNIEKSTSSTLIATVTGVATNKKVYFEKAHTSTPTTWSQITDIRQTETGAVLQLSNVNGTVYFENAYIDGSGNTTWASATTNVKNLSTNTAVSSTTMSGNYLLTLTAGQTQFRARLAAAMSGHASATLISNYFLSSSTTASSTADMDIISFTNKADPTVTAGTAFTLNTVIPTFNSYISSAGTDKYILPLLPSQIIRTMVSATVAMPTSPTVTFNQTENTASYLKTLNLACWYSYNGGVFTACTSTSPFKLPQNTFATNTTNLNWIPSYHIAADGSTSTTAPLSASYTIKIRAYDNGYIGTNMTTTNPLTTTCFSAPGTGGDKTIAIPGLTDYSCQDIDLDLKVVESMQLPNVTVYTASALGSSNTVTTGAMLNMTTFTGNQSVNVKNVWESSTAPVPAGYFKIRIQPASDHAVDIPNYFTMEVNNPSSLMNLYPIGSNPDIDKGDSNLWPFAAAANGNTAPQYTFSGNTPKEFLLKIQPKNPGTIPTSTAHSNFEIKIHYFKDVDGDGNIEEIGDPFNRHTINIKPESKP